MSAEIELEGDLLVGVAECASWSVSTDSVRWVRNGVDVAIATRVARTGESNIGSIETCQEC